MLEVVQSMTLTLLQLEHSESGVTHTENTPSIRDPMLISFLLKQSILQSECKTSYKVTPIFNEHSGSLVFDYEPHICGSPLCKNCLPEKKEKIKDHYRPFFKYGTNDPYLTHLIFSYPSFLRSELAVQLPILIKQTSVFFMLVRKSYKYYFRAVVLIEPHYQPETNTYNFHMHAGIFNFCNRERLKALWDKAFHGDYVVKYPVNPKTGEVKYKVKKYAFLDYVAKRRSEQALTVPVEDYYFTLRDHQLVRRIGFSKRRLALIAKIRKENSGIPDGFIALRPFFIPITWDISWFKDRFRTHFEAVNADRGDILTHNAMAYIAYQDTKDDYENRRIQDDNIV